MGQIDNLRAIAGRAKGFARAAKYEVEIIGPEKHPGASILTLYGALSVAGSLVDLR